MKTPGYESSGEHRRLTFVPTPPETKRTYLFPGGDKVELEGVTKVAVSAHGNHMVTCADGTTHVVPWGWLCLSYPTESNVAPKEGRPALEPNLIGHPLRDQDLAPWSGFEKQAKVAGEDNPVLVRHEKPR